MIAMANRTPTGLYDLTSWELKCHTNTNAVKTDLVNLAAFNNIQRLRIISLWPALLTLKGFNLKF